MVDAVKPYNKIIFKTQDSKTIRATKHDGAVTYKKPSVGAIIGGVIAGSIVERLINQPYNPIGVQIMKRMGKISNSLSADEFNQVEKAVADTIKNSGLEAKGVEIIKATAENAEEISKIMSKEIDKGITKYFPKEVKELMRGIISSQMTSGGNACYAFTSKKIIMPEKELGLALFHEAGHAMNTNLSNFGKILQACRPMIILALPIGLIALWKTKKAPDEEPKNGLDKVTTFIKNNAGKLTFATFLPTLLEEGLASIKGNNFAKQLLSPELARKVAKTNALGFSTYLLMAVLNSLGIYLGIKVKDSIASRKIVTEDN